MKNKDKKKGFTLMEIVLGVSLFASIAIISSLGFRNLFNASENSRKDLTAIAIANEQIEIVRNLPFGNVGIAQGVPSGVLPHSQTITRDSTDYNVTLTIRNIDDPSDGTALGGDDSAPGDYKFAQVDVLCKNCEAKETVTLTTFIAPKHLEVTGSNGSLIIEVYDSEGQPVPQAGVIITNDNLSPEINIVETTTNNGKLAIIDTRPDDEGYHIEVTKTGYTTDQTYDPNSVTFDPFFRDTSVSTGGVNTQAFVIDKLSQLVVFTKDNTCQGIPDVNLKIQGEKMIGENPDTYKYNQSISTDSASRHVLTDVEWDSYNITMYDNGYSIAGTIPPLPLSVPPESQQEITIVLESFSPKNLLVIVKDYGTGLQLSNASVRVHANPGDYDETLITGQGYLRQTDWSGGSGQAEFVNETMYYNDDGNIEVLVPAGDATLKLFGETYFSSGTFTSSTFDTGISGNFIDLTSIPGSQPPQTGDDSLKFQIASNNDNSTWNFLGPDGTSETYYASSASTINSVHDDTRYIRYKAYLSTEDTEFTPNLSEAAITYTSSCLAPGQAFFESLPDVDHDIEVSLEGYQTHYDAITITGQKVLNVSLNPI